MPRHNPHSLRVTQDLAGIWDFAFLGEAEPDAIDPAAIRFDDLMAVPACFDASPRYAGRRGLAAYRRRLRIVDDTPHRLVLDGAHHWCRVFLGGRRLGDHVGGFTRFGVDLPAGAREADLVVLVDNRLDYHRCPLHMGHFDWYHYGGIARGAELHRLGTTWIESVRATTLDHRLGRVAFRMDYGTIAAPGKVDFAVALDGREVLRETLELRGRAGRVERTLELPGYALWSPAAPNLHLLEVRLGADDLRQRIGLRQVEVRGQDILINGGPVRLLGLCRHEAHPQLGHTQPEHLLISDLQQLRDLGVNFVRGSHYPQDTRFLDLCDEAGVCVWSESIGWQHTAEQLCDPRFIEAQLGHIEEMVAQSAEHPSVILWGILNESDSHKPECRPAYAKLLGRLRELDPSRPVSFATYHWSDDACLDLPDVVGLNVYPGWYWGELPEVPANLDKALATLDARGAAGKPVIVSEIGAGAIPGWRDAHGARWTEQYQARLLSTVIRHLFRDGGRAMGLAIWLFNDFRSTEEVGRILGRPRGFNDKGIVDEYRRPKMAYEAVREEFRKLGARAL